MDMGWNPCISLVAIRSFSRSPLLYGYGLESDHLPVRFTTALVVVLCSMDMGWNINRITFQSGCTGRSPLLYGYGLE